MKEWESNDGNTELYNGDCLEVMDKLIEEGVKIDLIVTSPPYNIKDFHANQIKYSNYEGNSMTEETYQKWQIEVLNRCYDLLEDGGSIMYNHKVRIKKGEMIHPLEWLFKTKFILKQEITWWQKKGANVDKCRFFPFSERIYWLTKSPKTKMINVDKIQDVIEFVPTHKRKDTGHPAVMPFEIAEMLIKPFGDKIKILDPFMGVASTGVACKNLKMKFIGIELDEGYFDIGVERIKNNSK